MARPQYPQRTELLRAEGAAELKEWCFAKELGDLSSVGAVIH